MNKSYSQFENNRYIANFFTVICAFLMSLSCSNNPFTVGNTGIDSSVFVYVGRTILNGGMPYRDSFDHKGPLIYLIDAFGQLINKDIGMWIVEVVFIYTIFFFAYKIARMTGCGNIKTMLVVTVTMVTLSYYFEGGNFTEEYACTFIMISLYIFLRYFTEGSVKAAEIVICGAAFAAVCMLRINMAALWAVMCIGVLIDCIRKRKGILLAKYLGLFLLGAAVVMIPIIIWLVINNSFEPFIKEYIYFNIVYSKSEGSSRNILEAVHHFGTEGPVVLSIPIIGYFCLKRKEFADWLCEAAVILSVVLMSMSGRTYGHYGMILVPFVSYAFSLLLNESGDIKKNISLLMAGMCMIAMLLQLGVYRLASGVVKSVLHIEYGETDDARAIVDVIRNNTDEDDKITVCGNWDQVYLLTDRMSASVYSYQDPISKVDIEIREEYLNDLKQLKAKMIVLNKSSDWYKDKDLETIVNQNYELIQVVGSTELYLLR